MSLVHDASHNQQVERIVREVLARLTKSSEEGHHGTALQMAENQTARDQLVIAEHVVTVTTLAGRTKGKRVVVVPQRAIVTPAARDLLREQGVALERQAPRGHQAQLGLRRVIAVAETNFEPTAMLTGLRGIEFEHVARVGLVGVIDEVVDRVVRGGAIGLVYTDQADAALCLANRSSGVRAVLARSAEKVRRARVQLAANVFVVEPARKSVFELRQIIAASIAPGGHTLDATCRLRLA